MKNIIRFLFACTLLVSCEGALDRQPVDQLTPESAFQNTSDLARAISAMYDSYPTFGELLVNSIHTDNTKIGEDNGGQRIEAYNLNIAAGTGGDAGLYRSYSLLSNRASRAIAGAALLTIDAGNTADLALRDNLVGQAYAMRAFAHLKMFEYFTPNYLDLTGSAPPYIDFVAVSSTFPAKSTVAEYTAKLQADFDTADSLLEAGNSIDVANKNMVTFMRARFAIATGKNVDAINFATTLITLSGTRLATIAEYPLMFQDLDNNEVIFKRDYIIGEQGSNAGVWFFTGTGGEIMEVSTDLVNELDQVNDPARYNATILLGTPSGALGIGKYQGSDGVPFLGDMKEMRISELYLLRAEAHARENQLTQAAANIQTLRDARLVTSPAVSYISRDAALNDILAERRLELCFEGHRWKDLKRFGQGFTRDAADCGGATPCTLSAGDFRFTLPYPETEVLNNPNFLDNNPGY